LDRSGSATRWCLQISKAGMNMKVRILALATLSACLPMTTQLAAPTYVKADPGQFPMYTNTGDFNGDGKLDLIVGSSATDLSASRSDIIRGSVSLYLGKGDGTFQAPLNLASSGGPRGLCVVDLNGDSKLDLAITDLEDGGYVSVLLGNGDGSF